MAVDTTITLSKEILDAFENEEVLTQEQLREFLTFRAALMGYELDEALERVRDGSLPQNEDGGSFRMYALLLDQK